MRRRLLRLLFFALVTRDVSAQGGTVRVLWDMNAANEAVIHYWVDFDDDNEQLVYTTGPQCNYQGLSCYADFPVTDNAIHKISIWAANQWGYGPGAYISFSLGTPSAPINLRLTLPTASSTGFNRIEREPPPPVGVGRVPTPQPGGTPRTGTLPPRPNPNTPGGPLPGAPTVR